MLALAALARGREVVISRAELVEIGGGFRVPGRDGAVGRAAARGGHDEPHARGRLRAGDQRARPARSCACTRPTSASKDSWSARRLPSWWRWAGASRSRSSRISAAGSRRIGPTRRPAAGAGADRSAERRGRRRRRLLQRRQAARRAAGRRHRRAHGAAVDDPQAPAAARAARRQAHVRRARGHARRAPGGAGGRGAAGAADGEAQRGSDRRARGAPGRRLRAAGWRREVVDGVSTIGGGSAPGSGLPTRLVALERDGLSADALDARSARSTRPSSGASRTIGSCWISGRSGRRRTRRSPSALGSL